MSVVVQSQVVYIVMDCLDKIVMETDDLFMYNKPDLIHWTFVFRNGKRSIKMVYPCHSPLHPRSNAETR